MNGAWKTISGWLGREMEARNLEESEIERRKMNLKAVEQLPDSVVHLTYLTKKEAGLRQEEYACPDQKIMNEKAPCTDRKNPCIGAFQHEDYKHSAGNTFT